MSLSLHMTERLTTNLICQTITAVTVANRNRFWNHTFLPLWPFMWRTPWWMPLWFSRISVWVLSHEHSYPSFIARISKVLITANTKDCFLCVVFQLQTKNEPENWFLKRKNFREISLWFIDKKNVIKFYFTHLCKINYTLQNSIKPNCNTTSFQCSFIRYLEVLTLDE